MQHHILYLHSQTWCEMPQVTRQHQNVAVLKKDSMVRAPSGGCRPLKAPRTIVSRQCSSHAPMAGVYCPAYCSVPGMQPPVTPLPSAGQGYRKLGAITGPRRSRAEGAKPQIAVTTSPLQPPHWPPRVSTNMLGASVNVASGPAFVVLGTGTPAGRMVVELAMGMREVCFARVSYYDSGDP